MNPLLTKLQPYPFERLRTLFDGVVPNANFSPISLGIGEPKHPTPALIGQAMAQAPNSLSTYPATNGIPGLRVACANWVKRRYQLDIDPNTQVLPVNGTREALFAIAQTVIDASQAPSVGLHAKFGFVQCGHFREVGFKFGQWLDVVYMQKVI